MSLMEIDSTGQDVKSLEHSTLKVPYEILNKKFRIAQKVFDRETTHVVSAGSDLDKLLSAITSKSISTSMSRSSSCNSSGKKSKKGSKRSLDKDDTSIITGAPTSVIVAAPSSLSASTNNLSTEEAMDSGKTIVKQDSVTSILSKIEDVGSLDLESNTTGKTQAESMSMDDSGIGSSGHLSLEKELTTPKKCGPSGKEVSKFLGALVDRLSSLKRKAGESINEELDAAGTVRKRVQHLKSYKLKSENDNENSRYEATGNINAWKRTRLNRMLVDHLLREGMYETSKVLATKLEIEDLTNIEVFWAAKEVEESLKRHETCRMVAWCYENKSKLRKIHSTLELEIRVQEFIELARNGKRIEAVKHARKYLAEADDPDHIVAVKRCMGLLAFPVVSTGIGIHPYYELLSEDRWASLITHFRLEHARLYQLTPTSVLGTVVQAGLQALKTPHCYRPSTKNPNCPVCTEPLSTLADCLPYAHCAHSQLVCAISGEPLNENNPAMVLPSGYVYGTNSLKEMSRTNGGKVICSRSGRVFSYSEAERVFVM